ncbi:hypothetical protein D9M68_277530 [compost metagenome]
MHHGGGKAIAKLPHDGQQAFVGVPLMEKHRLAQFGGQCELFFQGLFLLRARREVAIEVQPALAHRAHPCFAQEYTQLALAIAVPVARFMGVDTGGAEQSLAAFVQLLGCQQGLFAVLQVGAGQHQLADAGCVGALQYGADIAGKAGMGQIDADVDELHGATSVWSRAA